MRNTPAILFALLIGAFGIRPAAGADCVDETRVKPRLNLGQSEFRMLAPLPPDFDVSWLRSGLTRRPLAVGRSRDGWAYQLFLSDDADRPRWRIDLRVGDHADGVDLVKARPYEARRDGADWHRYVRTAPLRAEDALFTALPNMLAQLRADDLRVKDVGRALRHPDNFAPIPIAGGRLKNVAWSPHAGFVGVLYSLVADAPIQVRAVARLSEAHARRLILESARRMDAHEFRVMNGQLKGWTYAFAPGAAERLARQGWTLGDVRRVLEGKHGIAPIVSKRRETKGRKSTHWAARRVSFDRILRLLVTSGSDHRLTVVDGGEGTAAMLPLLWQEAKARARTDER